MDTLTVMPIEDDDNLLNTIDSHIKLRKLKEVMLLCRIIKLLSISSADKYSKKHLEVREADALKQVGVNVREGGNKNCSSLYYSDSNSDTATRKTRIKASQLRKASEEEELAKTKKEKREKEAWEREAELDGLLDSDDYCLDSSPDIDPKDDLEDEEATTAKDLAREQKERLKALLNAKMRDSLSARLIGAYILYFKELLSDNGRIFASDTFTLRTRRKCEMPEQKVAIDPANSILCDLSDLLVVRFCIFSNPALENIGILTNEEVVEMQTNTATAFADKLAAVNKLIMAEANMPAVHSEATKHCLALSAARFALVCGFGKVDRHVFRADNTISRAQLWLSFIRIFESITKDTNGKHGLCPERGSAVDKVTGKYTYKTYINGLVINRQWRDVVANVRCSAD
ncbi:hypothetical protein HBH50_066460 [Parastagonospora nodorum]|nr:hypothetical protein HBH50_066460 [Parastagonospora nodorum]KAH4094524.1 hypothetical protein HBH48_054740 [Parastagonospora nodorum]